MANLEKVFNNLKVYLYKTYGNKPGKMLIHTGIIGWIMSSAAQIFAIVMNDKLTAKEKMFMIPQEFADAVINIISFYVVTQSVQSLASNLVTTGKLLPKNVRNYLTKIGLQKEIGHIKFNIGDLPLPKDIKSDYYAFKDGVDVISTITGSVLSCNVITPVMRNIFASNKQKKNIAYYDKNKELKYPYYKQLYLGRQNTGANLKI